jgi:hypothetical protein
MEFPPRPGTDGQEGEKYAEGGNRVSAVGSWTIKDLFLGLLRGFDSCYTARYLCKAEVGSDRMKL